jgi:hypothetical protein
MSLPFLLQGAEHPNLPASSSWGRLRNDLLPHPDSFVDHDAYAWVVLSPKEIADG